MLDLVLIAAMRRHHVMEIGALAALVLTPIASAQITSHDGHARVQPTGTIMAHGSVRVVVGCPTGGTKTCKGTVTLKTRGAVRVAGKRGLRVLALGRAAFDQLAPGQTETITLYPAAPDRRYVRRHRRVDALGRVVNEVDGTRVPTVNTVKLTR